MEEVLHSPINNNELTDFLTAKDYTVSGEEFIIKMDEISGLLVTTPRPLAGELGKYYESKDYISHTDGNSSLLEKVYSRIRSYSLKRKLALIESMHPKGSLLDVGCGTGAFLQTCKQAGWEVQGVEPGEKATALANSKTNAPVYSSLFDSQLDNHTFDVITLWHVLEHMPDLNAAVHRLKQLLNPNGVLVVAVPNYNSYDALHYGKYWAAYDVPRHLYHFSQQSIKELFSTQGFKLQDTKPMIFDSFYVSLLSEQYKKGRKRWFSAFLTGLESNIKAQQTGEYSSLIYILKRNGS